MSKVIYFSGPDGSGKTTSFLRAIERIEQNGKTAFQLRTLQVGRLRILARAKAKQQASRDETLLNTLGSVGRLGYSDLPRHRGHGFKFVLRRYVGLIAAIIDIATIGRLFVREKAEVYDVVLVEECPFDVFAKRHRPFFPWTANFLKRLVPKPDAVIFCVANASEIVQRKPELTEEEIEHYYMVMGKVYDAMGLPIHVLDTNTQQTPNSKIDVLIQKILL